jgi:hypothetical protein
MIVNYKRVSGSFFPSCQKYKTKAKKMTTGRDHFQGDIVKKQGRGEFSKSLERYKTSFILEVSFKLNTGDFQPVYYL